jgi:aspartate kinase
MEIIVQKFGGTSVADLDRIKHVANIIKAEIDANNHVVAVVSAMAGVTNSLITKCNQLSRLDKPTHMLEYDAVLASGEVVTAALLALQLQTMGLKAKSLQGWQIPFKTCSLHGNSQVTEIDSGTLIKLLDNGIIPVITGFQGITDNGDISTLGKGGSDTSAALIAASLKATRCDIYTDVDGIYSADPRIVNNAKKIDKINIDELYALCTSGAKILHPRAALAAKRYNFPMRILSSFTNNSGTTIETKEFNMENNLVTAITSNKNLLKIDIEHKLGDFNQILANFAQESVIIEQLHNLNKTNSCIITSLSDKNKCQTLLESLKSNSLLVKYDLSANISTVTVVGYGIKNDSRLIGQIIAILTNNNIEILSSDLSDIKISMLINEQENEKAIKLLHDHIIKQ